MKKHTYLITLLLLVITGLGLLGCSEEDIFEKNKVLEVNSIISQFSPETFNKVISSGYKVDWNVSTPLEHSDELSLDYYEFGISLSENQAPITSKLYDIKQSLFAIKKEGGAFDFYVVKYFMDRWKSEGKSVKDVSLSKMEGFSGLLNVFDNNNQMIYAKKMDNGKVLGAPVSLNSDFNTINIETRMFENCEVVPIYHYVDTYHPSSDGQWWIYQYSDLVSISYDLECSTGYLPELDLSGGAPGSYFSQNGGGVYSECEDPRHGCIYEVETELSRFEDLIDDSKLKPCMKTIVSDLKGLNQGMGWVINRFNASGSNPMINAIIPKYDWEISDGRITAPNKTAVTSSVYNSSGMVTTTFDTNKYGNASDLSIARTILHEALHAYMVVEMRTNMTNYSGNFPTLWADYVANKFGSTLEDYQHAEIAANFTGPLALSLQEFGVNRGYSLPYQFYSDMAWAGLQGTVAFSTLSSSDQQRIGNVMSVELSGKDLQGNSVTKKGNNGGC